MGGEVSVPGRRTAVGRRRLALAAEFGISRETVYRYLRAEPTVD
ncbi:helix-turn-helix domain-containing protein [Nocardia asteroides]|nr:helix-turn-helix domain-containing protein [Nocardia asteroides]